MPKFYFRTNAKVEKLVGRELITNNTIALFELIKNAYDAGAKKIEINFKNFNEYSEDSKNNHKVISNPSSIIEVIDNGHGMSTQDIQEYWMELGTPHKENKRNRKVRIRNNEIDKIITRTVNGEKGIGRFGVDKIGSHLLLSSIDNTCTVKTEVEFNWDLFNDTTKLIQDIPCEYKIKDVNTGEESGTKLIISDLRDHWTQMDLIKLKRNLKKFLSPVFMQQDEFRIFFSYQLLSNNQLIIQEEIKNDTFDYLKTKLSAKVTGNSLEYFIEDNLIKVREEHVLMDNTPLFGDLSIDIFYLDPGDKNIFTRKMGLRPADYGNIKIFKDNFRVMPYGDPDNDWLEIDKAHSYGFFRTFGTRDIMGHILLSHDPVRNNLLLREATDRVGLIEDVPAFGALKDFVWYLIRIFQDYVFNRIKSEAKEATQLLKDQSKDLKKEAREIFDSYRTIIEDSNLSAEQQNILTNLDSYSNELIKKIDTVDRASKEIEKKIKIFSQMTSKEGILFEMLHVIKNKLAVIDAQLRDLKEEAVEQKFIFDVDIIDIAFQDIYKLVTGSLDKVNNSKLQKVKTNVYELINETIQFHKPILIQNNVSLITNFDDNEVSIRCSPDAIKSVFENLFNNSIKALENKDNKKIFVDYKTNEQEIEIYFSDNGKGIDNEKIPLIFSLWTSDTNGSGIGLASAKDIIEDHYGNISYVDMFEVDKKTTFLIKLPIL